MSLKFKLQSKEQIPGGLESFYVEHDGALVLDVEGVVEKSKLDEFRNNNVAVMRERDELKQRFAGIDPDSVKTLLAEKARLEEEKLIKDGEVEKLVERRVQAAVGDWEKRSIAAEQQVSSLTARMVETEIKRAAVEAATKLGLRGSAVQDLQARAEKTFKMVDGVAKALDADGKTPVFGKDGVTPLNFDEWAARQVVEAPHLFESNAGGGAVGNRSGGAGNGDNPWKKDTFNLTRQGQVFQKDPARARSLMAAAGVKG